MYNPTESAKRRIRKMEKKTTALQAHAEHLEALHAAHPEATDRPSRKVRDQADMRVAAFGDHLVLQTRVPTWRLTLLSWAGMLLGLAGWVTAAVVAGPNPIGGWTSLLGFSLLAWMVGLNINLLHHPDGSPKSWHTHPVDTEVLEGFTKERRPYLASTPRVNSSNERRRPALIWLIPDDQKASLRAATDEASQ